MRARRDWLYTLNDDDLDELAAVISRCARYRDLREISRDDVDLPFFEQRLKAIRAQVLHDRGFSQLRGFPIESYTRRETAIAYWAIGMHIGDEFASRTPRVTCSVM